MRVLSLVPGLDPARGGIASAATNMILAGRRAGVESVVVVPDHGGEDPVSRVLVEQLERAGAVVRTLPTARWPRDAAYRWGISLAQVAWTARNINHFDVVHVHGAWGLGSVSGLMAGTASGTPVVVTAHESLTNFDIEGSRTSARRRQKLALKSMYVRYATLFILNSDIEARLSLPLTVMQRTVHLPLVRADGPPPALRARGQLRELRVGFLARIHPKKNLDVLIAAMGRLPEHVRLVIAGDGPTELVDGLRRHAHALGVSDRLEWLGFVEPTDRARLLASIDVLAMPSAFESFGLSAAEAMLDGVPVLVSERTGIAELVARRGGGRVIAANVVAVASAIQRLDLDRASLARLAAEGQAAVRKELDPAKIGCALRDAYCAAIVATKRERAVG